MSVEAIKSNAWEAIQHKSIYNKILCGNNVDLKGLPGSLKTLFLSVVSERLGRPMLVVLPSREDAELVAEELSSLMEGDGVAFFPGGEENPESPMILNPRRAGLQMQVVRDLLCGSLKVVVASPDGIVQKLPSPETVKKAWIELSEGVRHDLYELVEKLIDFGYVRESIVEKPGEISLRGGILDVFPFTGEEPHRVEFFGNQIESMRSFDVTTQLSTGNGGSLLLIHSPIAWEDRSASLFSYSASDPLIFLEDPELILAEVDKELHEESRFFLRSEELEKLFLGYQRVSLHTLSSPEGVLDFGGQVVRRFGRGAAEIRKGLISICHATKNVFLICGEQNRRERIQELLGLDDDPIPGLRVEVGHILQGFYLPSSGLAVYTEGDLFGRILRRRRRDKFQLGVPIRELSALKPGDFVVHVDHGIGEYRGLEKISVKGTERECVVIQYQDGDKLYVSVEMMERVQKYTGREGVRPVLNKLGGKKWERLKAKTKQSIKNIAKELITLYSVRRALPGFSFSQDTTWQKELETTFCYEETLDQARAVGQVKRDMEQSRPMDRLVCGDVGYGKTEVAVRAAFKAVTDGKQVVLLVPTTVLAQQHFRTFQERLSRYPVNIEVLSRFRSRKEQKKIVEKLRRGEVDIVIGTHRLLSKDVGFKDLGLLMVDEEQRFGVRHKERLKAFRKTVDVLTLSATPIPRTLHFSLMGIRDMSLINTPPKDRLPIVTEVVPFDERIVVEAIERELTRGGQVFFVHNRIRSIPAMARMIRGLVPGIRLAVAHGRMDEEDLERVMVEFVEGKHDCLVATMIIESGLDMPNVNTLIVHRADRLGLAQLYQLRGRVGRSDRQAYAYLLTPPFHLLSPEAVKRLRTIEEFTELGSGFQIALRDLEIRGAGNLLGVEQSGYMDAVGFDLYTRFLDEAVREVREETEGLGEAARPTVECRVEIDLAAYLPESYVLDGSLRVNLYRRLSEVQSFSGVDGFSEELRDRFGPLPLEAKNLLDVARLRLLGQQQGVKRIVLEGRSLLILFDEGWIDRFSTPELFSQRLRSMIDSSPVPMRFLQDKEFGLRTKIPEEEPISFTKKLLQSWG